MKPLVSILIPAYNAENLIEYTLRSAIAQTWPRKEIIVVDDGSTDRTAEVARRYSSKGVSVISLPENQGVAAAENHALRLYQGDYIQWLAADDLLGPDKIERQMAALQEGDSRRLLLSCPWAHFYYRTRHARFINNSLCQSLSPVEWLLRKMRDDLHMQPATWLTSRELADAAGPFDTRLVYDDDGEYFCRVLLASEGTHFVPDAHIFYRVTGTTSVSYVGRSSKKRDAYLISLRLHVQYLRSLEDSERVHKACLAYLQSKSIFFYPERMDLFVELQSLAKELGGELHPPRLRWKYAWMRPILGHNTAKWAQITLPQFKSSIVRAIDKAMFDWESRGDRAVTAHKSEPAPSTAQDE